MGKHEKAFREFLNGIDYLSNDDAKSVLLIECGKQLDENWTTRAYAEALKTIRYIETKQPIEKETDEEDDLLSPNR